MANHQQAIDNLLSILSLEPLEENLFRGRSPDVGWQRVFGGQVIGQALMAATRTVQGERRVHSLHSYFMRPGDPSIPIIYEVDKIRDGGSFTTRRVVAIQHGQAIFSMSASFHIREEGLEHQFDMPEIPKPDDLIPEDDFKKLFMDVAPKPVREYWKRDRPLELRPVSLKHYITREKMPPYHHVWLRATAPLPDDHAVQACVLAYASDMTLLDTALYPHGRSVFDKNIQAASLDHSMWFHRDISLNDWLLYSHDTPNASGGRGFTRGQIFDLKGNLVASTAQEGLIRLRNNEPKN
jgi:acyl-CoA thioesterase-2